MYKDKLERANILAKNLIPKVDVLINMPKDIVKLANSISGLSEWDEQFRNKFRQLLDETKARLQKEFDELQ